MVTKKKKEGVALLKRTRKDRKGERTMKKDGGGREGETGEKRPLAAEGQDAI